MLYWICRPISNWPLQDTTPERERDGGYRFKTGWSNTMELLAREIDLLGADECIVEIDIQEHEIRNDGQPRASARPVTPRVAVFFESDYGPLMYRCDLFRNWQHNVKAIAMTLERLRKAEMYGVTKRGEQYTGFKALPDSYGNQITNVEDAAKFLAKHQPADKPLSYTAIMRCAEVYRDAYRKAAMQLHPDQGGSEAEFRVLQEAKVLLDGLFNNNNNNRAA